MKIITISREFGSGGREIGKRVADILGFDYYDKEIINSIAANKGLDENYVYRTLENQGWRDVPLNFSSAFSGISLPSTQIDLLVEQKHVIEEIAKLGRNCIIVGRNADVLLEEYKPFKIFLCANMEAKIQRCKERASKDENLSSKEIAKKIRRIDKTRAQTCAIITGSDWGQRKNYHITINTSDWDIKELTQAVADLANHYFL